MPADASKEEVEAGFDQVKALLLEVMMGALGSYPYELSWRTLTQFGDVEFGALLAIEPGSPRYPDALARMKHLVESAMILLP